MSVLAITSFGMFLLPGALLMLGMVALRARFWPDILGALDGIGVAVLWPALVNWGIPRCQPGVIMTVIATERGEFRGGGCTTIDYRLWAFSGLALMLVGFVGHRLARRGAYATRTSEPLRSDEGRAREMAPWLVGPLAATGVLIAFLFVGFLASAGGMVIGGMIAFVVGTVAAMLVDSRWGRNAAIVAG
jgi:hypothetical protein